MVEWWWWCGGGGGVCVGGEFVHDTVCTKHVHICSDRIEEEPVMTHDRIIEKRCH